MAAGWRDLLQLLGWFWPGADPGALGPFTNNPVFSASIAPTDTFTATTQPTATLSASTAPTATFTGSVR